MSNETRRHIATALLIVGSIASLSNHPGLAVLAFGIATWLHILGVRDDIRAARKRAARQAAARKRAAARKPQPRTARLTPRRTP